MSRMQNDMLNDHIAQYLRIYITEIPPEFSHSQYKIPSLEQKTDPRKNIQTPYKTQIPPNKTKQS